MGEKESARRSTLMEKRYASLACNHRPYAFVYFLGLLLQYRVDFRISLVSHQVLSSLCLLPQEKMFQ